MDVLPRTLGDSYQLYVSNVHWREKKKSSCSETKSLQPNELTGPILVKVHFIDLNCTKRTNHSKKVQHVMYAVLAKNKTFLLVHITKTIKG